MTPLNAQMIARTLRTRRLGHPALVFDTIGSTNDECHHRALAGAGEGLLVLAEEQTAGRGRLDRTWWAPAGSCLLMSMLLRPSLPAGQAGQLTMCLGLGAVEAIEEMTGASARLKWPNDLLVGGRKLGGMLTELNTVEEGRLDYAVLGLGLNVNVDFRAQGAPSDVSATATSLSAETGQQVDRLRLLGAILGHTEEWYDRTLGGASPHQAWAERLDTLGRRVRVSMTTVWLEGVAVGVTPEGGLLVQEDSGEVRTVWSGDVTWLR